MPVQVELAGRTETAPAVNWQIGGDARSRMRPIDLSASYNAEMERLFSPKTQWRIDYTGAQHGVDRRHPMPLRDERGFFIMNGVLSLFDFGVLPEQSITARYIQFDRPPPTIAGVPFRTVPGKIMAVCCTEPYQQFPSKVVLRLPEPKPAEKLYLLSANLVKTLKCYYPARRSAPAMPTARSSSFR